MGVKTFKTNCVISLLISASKPNVKTSRIGTSSLRAK
jgi:hypothetical protein